MDDLVYDLIAPEFELEGYQNQINLTPDDPLPYYKAAIIAYENGILNNSKIISLLEQAFSLNLPDFPRLEKMAKLFNQLGFHELEKKVLQQIIRAYGTSMSAYIEYLNCLISQPFWNDSDDEIFRYVLDQAQAVGLNEGQRLIFSGLRTLKSNKTDDAINFLYDAKKNPDISQNTTDELLAASFFKKGNFWVIINEYFLKKTDKDRSQTLNLFTLWAVFISKGNILDSDISIPRDPPTVFHCLTDREKNALEAFVEISAGNEEMGIALLRRKNACITELLTQYALCLKKDEHGTAKSLYYEIISKSARFEKELRLYKIR